MSRIENVREVMRELAEISKGERISSAAYLGALSEKLRAAMPIAPGDARPGEFYRVRFADDWKTEYVGTRPKDGVTVAQGGESITFQWRLLTELGNDTVADDHEIEMITGRKLA